MRWLKNIGPGSAFLWISLVLLPAALLSQSRPHRANIHFYQLNTAHGLSDNYIYDMCMDKNGNLWIASGEGLNMFNGKTVTKFFKSEYPQLQSDYMRQLLCDDKNRIWVMAQGGLVTMIDENRQFHKISLNDSSGRITARWMLKTKEQGIVLFTRKGFFFLSPAINSSHKDSLTRNDFSFVTIRGFDSLQALPFSQIEPFDENNYILSRDEGLYKINFREKRVEKKYELPGLYILLQWQPGELLAFDKKNPELQSIHLDSRQTSWPLRGVKDQYGHAFTAKIVDAKMLNEELLALTTAMDGMYLFNTRTRSLIRCRHSAADPTTIVNDWPTVITPGINGWVFIGAPPNGISYFKYNAAIGQQTVFQDNKGNSYDGHISKITTLDNDVFYIATGNNLLKWRRSTNSSSFVDYTKMNGEQMMYKDHTSSLEFDAYGRLWFNTGQNGVFVLNKNDQTVHQFQYDTSKPNSLIAAVTPQILKGPDGYMWLATRRGVCRVNPQNFTIDYLQATALKELKNIYCYELFFADKNNLWIATNGKGLWHYNFSTDSLRNFTEKNGFISNVAFSINSDKEGNIYAGTDKGLHIFLRNGRVKQVTQKDGLMNSRVEALIRDNKNRMWIGNDVGIACFNIADSSLKYFDETYGLSIQGFRIAAYCRTSEDEQIWGTERGLQYFFPDELYQYKAELKVNIDRIETRNVMSNLTQSHTFDLKASDNYVSFYFSTIEYLTQLRTFYEYKLEGLDDKWIKVINQNFVRYSSLSPGEYTFRVRASNDNKNWTESGNAITIRIATPYYQTWWFRILGALSAIAILLFVISFYRRRQLQKRTELETELVITQFASQINRHKHVDELLWDVTKNCISRLHFEDCVIYLKDERNDVLVQKAAYGPKSPVDLTIHQPIEIPVGKGIVGTVAQTGKPELVNDTEKDSRYIVDDERRFSELAVPIIIDGMVAGVIDSEHSRKNFFTARQLQILSAVSVLCANQLQSIKAEEEMQKASLELLENKRKAMESRLQSLRLQMNPHFLFNALNSIQQMILANEEMVATRYLSRFSKLLRTILVHSDKEMVTLKDELEILNLYVELEAIRFKDSFRYTIECNEEIDLDEVKVPTLLIQPFVENAIWHGLMHKEGQRELHILFSEKDDNLFCVIEDNGIGRDKARETGIVSGKGKSHTSKGIAVSLERLKTLHGENGHTGSLHITDMKKETGEPAGTRVEICFPIQN